MIDEARLSAPAPRLHPPRELTSLQLATAIRLADALCTGPEHPIARPSQCPEFPELLDLALATRSDVFWVLVGALDEAAGNDEPEAWLRSLSAERSDVFVPLSAVLAGAYLMVPEVRAHVNYPGQGRNPAPYDQIVEELASGILDPVLERGPIHRTVQEPE